MIGGEWISFVAERLPELWVRTGEHLILSGVSMALAISIGIPLGIIASHYARVRGVLLGAVGVLQTIPSLAMLAILLALLNMIGVVPAIVALTLYALLPIVRNTLAGLQGVSPDIIEAATGIGMTERQQLTMVRLPLATPYIVAGIRTAAVVGVGIATLSAFIGAGGLGQFINRGLALSDSRLILLGAIPAGILALIVDGSIGAFQWGLKRLRKKEKGTFKAYLKIPALAQPLILVAIGVFAGVSQPSQWLSTEKTAVAPANTIKIGTKNFTEQFVLGELMAQLIERTTPIKVDRNFYLGGTMICHGALKTGEIDLYPEYTGTALTAILDKKPVSDPGEALEIVRKAYKKKFASQWLEPFGFNNTYAITVTKETAKKNGWVTVTDLVPHANELVAGFTAEFAERPDGYPGLKEAYNLRFKQVKDLDPAIMYEAVARGQVDVICAFATDGRIAAYNLKPLDDDLNFFPPYQAAPVVRTETLNAFPVLKDTLNKLAGKLSDKTMQRLNYEVDEKKRSPAEVALEYLTKEGLVGRK